MHQHHAPVQYPRHFGIDVSKDHLDIHCLQSGRSWRIANSVAAIRRFIDEQPPLRDALVVVDSTGGHELVCCETLAAAGIRVHRAHSYRLRSYIRSRGQMAKTDRLDARMLAAYGQERQAELRLFTPQGRLQRQLRQLALRREQLVRMRTREKNRLKAPANGDVFASIRSILRALQREIAHIEARMRKLVRAEEALEGKRRMLMAIPGIGSTIANALIALMPELGNIGNKQAAALAGLAPYARDSGKWRGKRHVGPGRPIVRRLMFMAAMVAVRHNETIRGFYRRLIDNGKKPIVALIAAARKLIVIINAKTRECLAEIQMQMS